jgi:hypothetical protein
MNDAADMFAGHFGVGFGLKRWAPALSLGTLFLAAQWVDLVWPTLLLLDLEHVRNEPGATKLTPLDFYDYPLTHSLLAACLWAVGFALGYGLLSRSKWAAGVCAFGVISHWGLDLLVHRPDLLLVPGGELRLGLGGGELPRGDRGVGGAIFWRWGLVVCSGDHGAGWDWPMGILRAGGIHRVHSSRQSDRSAAAECHGYRDGRACAVAVGAVGVVD